MKSLLISIIVFISLSSQFFAQNWEVVENGSNIWYYHEYCESYQGNLFGSMEIAGKKVITVFNDNLKIWEPTQILRAELTNSNDENYATVYFKNLNDTALLIVLSSLNWLYIDGIKCWENKFYLFSDITKPPRLINNFIGIGVINQSSFLYNDTELYFPVNTVPFDRDQLDVVRYKAQGVDTVFRNYSFNISFITPTTEGFFCTATLGTYPNTYKTIYYFHSPTTKYSYPFYFVSDPVSGVPYLNGALISAQNNSNPSPTKRVVYSEKGQSTVQWGDPNLIKMGAPIRHKGEVIFPTRSEVSPTLPALGMHKFLGPSSFQRIPFTEEFYNAFSGEKKMLEFLCVDKDYLYAKAGDKKDSVLFHGVVRYPLLNASNIAPVANDDAFAATDTASIVLTMRANDTDMNGDYIYSKHIKTGMGEIAFLTNYDFKYTAPQNFSGKDTVWYCACDLGGLCSDTAQIIITVEGVGKMPLLQNDVLQAYKSVAKTVDVGLNDEYQGENITLKITENTKNGTTVVSNTSQVKYTPTAGFIGLDSLEYQICKTYNYCQTAKLYITVSEHPNPPVCVRDEYQLSTENNFLHPLDNDSNTTGGMLSLDIIQGPFSSTAIGSKVTINTLFYGQSDVANFGKDSMEYRACNLSGLCSNQWMIFTSGKLGMTDLNQTIALKVYPNPALDHLQIETSVPVLLAQILDLQGKTIVEFKHTKSLPIENLSKGMYLLRVETEGGFWREVRFVKE
ncbi:MAG: T9SS type A sorting domain-containing protein [Bacteroidetes bacterium]|nr:T9SS type A sorting domain-containing protein [Bacteroidota bacterium]